MSKTEQAYIDHWNSVVEDEERQLATHDTDYTRLLEKCKRENARELRRQVENKRLLWIVGALPLDRQPMTKEEAHGFFKTAGDLGKGHSNDHNANPFTVVFIGDDGKQKRHHCFPLTIGEYGYAGGAAIDPWAKGDDICIVADCMSPDVSTSHEYNIIEFNMSKVISIVTCGRYKEIRNKKFDLQHPDGDFRGLPPPLMPMT